MILPTDKGKSTVIFKRQDYLEKCINHINNDPYQLLKKDPTTKIKVKTLKQLKVLKYNEFIDNTLYYYLKTNDSLRLDFMFSQKIHNSGMPVRPIVPLWGSPLCNVNKHTPVLLMLMLKMEIPTPKLLQRFPTTLEMFQLYVPMYHLMRLTLH